MGTLSGRRQRLQQFKDRKRRVKRKQAARVVAAGLLVVLAIVFVVVVIRAISGLRPKNAMTIPQVKGQAGASSSSAGSSIKLAFAQQFKPAPWFIAVDDRRLYVGEPNPDAKPDASGYPLSQIEAFPLDGKQRLWSTPLEAHCRELGISGQTLAAVAESTDGATISGYELTSGKPKWSVKPVAGMQVQIALDSNTVVAGYTPQNGGPAAHGRLVGYDSTTGARCWGVDLSKRLAGLLASNDACCVGNPQLELQCWEGLASYRLHNVIGLIDTRNSRFIREFAASEHILSAEADPARKVCFLVFSTGQDAYRLVRLPYEGKARTMANFKSNGQFLLLAEDGYVGLAYSAPGTTPLTQMACFKGNESEPSLQAQFDGLPVDLATLDGSTGQFLLALSAKADDDGQPAGGSTIQLASCSTGKVLEAARLRRPVLMLAPFSDGCLALMRGGDIQLLDTSRGQSRRLRKTKYEYLEAYTSADEKSLLVSSYPESYLSSTAGAPMQVMVFK